MHRGRQSLFWKEFQLWADSPGPSPSEPEGSKIPHDHRLCDLSHIKKCLNRNKIVPEFSETVPFCKRLRYLLTLLFFTLTSIQKSFQLIFVNVNGLELGKG